VNGLLKFQQSNNNADCYSEEAAKLNGQSLLHDLHISFQRFDISFGGRVVILPKFLHLLRQSISRFLAHAGVSHSLRKKQSVEEGSGSGHGHMRVWWLKKFLDEGDDSAETNHRDEHGVFNLFKNALLYGFHFRANQLHLASNQTELLMHLVSKSRDISADNVLLSHNFFFSGRLSFFFNLSHFLRQNISSFFIHTRVSQGLGEKQSVEEDGGHMLKKKLRIFDASRVKIAIQKSILFLAIFLASLQAAEAKKCTGRMVNPITDICWSCILPITIGSTPVVPGRTADTINYSSPVCICPAPPPYFIRVGLAVGYWEPIRLVDATKEPFCFVGIGGLKIDPGIALGAGGDPEVGTGTEAVPATWNVHWYQYPVFTLLSFVMDSLCMEGSQNFDVAYITEVDPLWQDDELSFLLSPESILFGNLIAQAACAADCLSASFWLPLDPLFWCAGCQGGMYPINGRVITHNTSIQSSSLAVARMIYKMHRETLLPITSGPEAICSAVSSAMIKKSQYRTQLTVPIPTVDPILGCNPLGKSTFFWESFREVPVNGEDFNYLLWRKRSCCVL
jgi:conjugal transfer pilus assembly protein TraU